MNIFFVILVAVIILIRLNVNMINSSCSALSLSFGSMTMMHLSSCHLCYEEVPKPIALTTGTEQA